MSPHQRGCMRGSRGCKDHLLLNKAILEDAHDNQKNLSVAWIDYQKAFDSIPHAWLLEVLNIYKFSPSVIRFLESAMTKWQVIMSAKSSSAQITTNPIGIRCGIFQGDSLSPLLFCLALNPLSHLLNSYKTKGYKLKKFNRPLNHLLYMDDLKLFAKNINELDMLLDSVEIFTRDIGMSFGLDKCKTLHLKRGKQPEASDGDHILISGQEIEELNIDQNYKYLGIKESGKINHKELRENVRNEYIKRVRKILNTKLDSRNVIKAINTYAVPVLTYSFAIVNWKASDLQSVDTKTRKLLTVNHCHNAKAEVERLYLPPEQGGRGLLNVESLHNRTCIKFALYLERKDDPIVHAIRSHDYAKKKYSIHQDAQTISRELGIVFHSLTEDSSTSDVKRAQLTIRNKTWHEKPMHGQIRRFIDKAHIDKEASFSWIKRQHITPSLEASIFAIQDQTVPTKHYKKSILKQPEENGICRLCHKSDETIHHIVSACEKLANTSFIWRHNNLVKYVHWRIAKDNNFDVPSQWWLWKLEENQVLENTTTKLLWEFPVQTDKTVNANRPDIIYANKTTNKTYLIDVTVPSDYNIGPKEIQKLEHYQQLKVEVKRLWHTEAEVIPIVVGATGIIAKSLRRYTEKLSPNINIAILQKQAAICSASIVSRTLSINPG